MITIGNDAEFILTHNDLPVSSVGLLGGTKKIPFPVRLGALQEDNVLAEINIHPAKTVGEWERNINTVVRQLKKKLPKPYSISNLASALYPDQELQCQAAHEFGCDPDYNAWTGQMNSPPKLPKRLQNLRTAGGHVHIGIEGLNFKEKMQLIQCLDTLGGIQGILLDTDNRRKLLYGKAGAMRLKDYGVEWRTPSNYWIHDKQSRAWIFKLALYCANNWQSLLKLTSKEVVGIINKNKTAEARYYLSFLKKHVDLPVHPNLIREK